MKTNNLRKQVKEAMEEIADIDLLYGLTISYKQRELDQRKINKAYNILDNLDAELERTEIRNKQMNKNLHGNPDTDEEWTRYEDLI